MNRIEITLSGVPVGKGRPRFVRATGRTYTPAKTAGYHSDLRLAAQDQMAGHAPWTCPVEVNVGAFMPIPKSWSKTKQQDALMLRIRPTSKPDADNLLKQLDALNEICWRDDSQVVEATVRKFYSDRPRLVIIITPWLYQDF